MVGLLVAAPSWACWDEAAARCGLSSHLLYAIARTESGLNPAAVGRNRDGSRDIGLMQINSSWLPTLASHGIAEHHLFDACTSIHVGAWILAGNVSRLGYTWEAVALGATSAFAGTTGTEFQTMYTTMLNWATGYLGKAIAVAAFILGAGIGVARSSPIPALAGVVFALFMVYVPTIIDSIMTATV